MSFDWYENLVLLYTLVFADTEAFEEANRRFLHEGRGVDELGAVAVIVHA